MSIARAAFPSPNGGVPQGVRKRSALSRTVCMDHAAHRESARGPAMSYAGLTRLGLKAQNGNLRLKRCGKGKHLFLKTPKFFKFFYENSHFCPFFSMVLRNMGGVCEGQGPCGGYSAEGEAAGGWACGGV